MRFRGMMVVLSLFAWGCGDDSGGPSIPETDGSVVDAGDAGRAQNAPDARVDGGMVVVNPDGSITDASIPDTGLPDVSSCSGTFALQGLTGSAPFFAAVTCSGVSSGAATYDWGEGAGFEASSTHRYQTAGTFTVKQQPGGAALTVTVTSFTPVRFSTTDHTGRGGYLEYTYETIGISPDGFEVLQAGLESSSVRSDDAISPGAGIFYFEGHRIADSYYRGALGIATKDASLDFHFDTSSGPNSQTAVYLMGEGSASTTDNGQCSGQQLDKSQSDTGYVVDYRGANPILHVLQDVAGTATILQTCTLPVTAPVYIFYTAERARVGYALRINTGADTTNLPFHYGAAAVRAAVTAKGDASGAAALVMGFGTTNAGRPDSPPTLNVPADMTVALGQTLSLQGAAVDAEDGTLDTQINWVDTTPEFTSQVPFVGKTFVFTANRLGTHPIRVSIRDLDGVVTTKTVAIAVTGQLMQFNPVQLVATDATTAAGISVSNDGLSAYFQTNGKDGIRANQGLIGDFWYFEVHRNHPTRNMGMGLVTEDGSLLPYESGHVPWSMSINVLGSGTAFINLITQHGHEWQTGAVEYADYGFAVDYRGVNPLVHIIIGNKLLTTLALTDTWVPLYPMLYGNGPDSPLSGFDYDINFGASGFAQDPRAALTSAQVDAASLKLGWGINAH